MSIVIPDGRPSEDENHWSSSYSDHHILVFCSVHNKLSSSAVTCIPSDWAIRTALLRTTQAVCR